MTSKCRYRLSPAWSRNSTSPCSSPQSPSSGSPRWSWNSHCSQINGDIPDSYDLPPLSPLNDDEHERIKKARERLARREVELRQIIRHCNGEMDIVRRKLCKDLGVMEVLKGEIEKAGTGPMREQLEEDFHNGRKNSVM